MKLDMLVGDRFRERPADCVIDSHALMVRGGYIKYVANGIYSSYPVLRRVTRKIEQIIREEMDAIDGQEVLFPVAMPAALWRESGRYTSVGRELARFGDRNGNDMLLGMTHEEAAVHLTREYGQTYAKYPFMVYQIQTKFRDELRPRGGLIRTREFTMKDAYSFHTTKEDLDAYYMRCYGAYERIFTRVGIPQAIAVTSDSGMMGGSASYEFILLSSVGEDTVVTCGNCEYRANMEAAECVVRNAPGAGDTQVKKVHTPGTKTIDEVCAYLGLPVTQSCKAVIYQKNATDAYVVVFLRGDMEVNETKLGNFLGEEFRPAILEDNEPAGAIPAASASAGAVPAASASAGAVPAASASAGATPAASASADAVPGGMLTAGFIGPYRLFTPGLTVLIDRSLKDAVNLCCGANEKDFHYIGVSMERDCGDVQYLDLAKAAEGGVCPRCGAPSLRVSRGVEVGHIFQLGDKYTKSMGMSFMDEHGNLRHPVMGCYGIGVGRLAAAVCEARHDEYGPVWPVSIAPWHTHLCCVRANDDRIKTFADDIYAQLLAEHIEVIYDDRAVSAGVMFSDADLIGAPYRVIVSPRNVDSGCCEIVSRDKTVNIKVNAAETASALKAMLRASD